LNVKVKIYKTIILPVVLYGSETWSLTLREEHRLRVFENRVLRRIFGRKRDEVTREWLVGPIFFSGTVITEKYQETIMHFISLLNEEERFCWLQQDGATLHTANSTMEKLKQFFDDRIPKNLWPPQSPDLTPPDYFIWGYLKQVVYSYRPQTIEDLKQNTEVAISNISQETLKESSVKHGDTCEYMLCREWQSFSTFTVKSCKLFYNMLFYVINCFNETRPTDCPFTPWVA
jgi:hypothetical protein